MVALIVADVANPHVLANMCEIIDDKSKYCVPFVVEQVRRHQQAYSVCGKFPPAFFVGLNGVQGAGKTTLVCVLWVSATPGAKLPTQLGPFTQDAQ